MFGDTDRIKPLLQKTAENTVSWKTPWGNISGKTIAFLNHHAINTATRDTEFYKSLMQNDFLLRDGIGTSIGLSLFGMQRGENLNGTDLIPKILDQYKDRKLAIWGSSDGAVQLCVERLQNNGFAHIVSAENGFHANDFYLDVCRNNQPEIILLCMGMPKQEKLAMQLRAAKTEALIICGGGWVDFYSGIKSRAPKWMQKFSLEWVYRLLQEPKRLGRRYTIDILYYFFMIITARLSKG